MIIIITIIMCVCVLCKLIYIYYKRYRMDTLMRVVAFFQKEHA